MGIDLHWRLEVEGLVMTESLIQMLSKCSFHWQYSELLKKVRLPWMNKTRILHSLQGSSSHMINYQKTSNKNHSKTAEYGFLPLQIILSEVRSPSNKSIQKPWKSSSWKQLNIRKIPKNTYMNIRCVSYLTFNNGFSSDLLQLLQHLGLLSI